MNLLSQAKSSSFKSILSNKTFSSTSSNINSTKNKINSIGNVKQSKIGGFSVTNTIKKNFCHNKIYNLKKKLMSEVYNQNLNFSQTKIDLT